MDIASVLLHLNAPCIGAADLVLALLLPVPQYLDYPEYPRSPIIPITVTFPFPPSPRSPHRPVPPISPFPPSPRSPHLPVPPIAPFPPSPRSPHRPVPPISPFPPSPRSPHLPVPLIARSPHHLHDLFLPIPIPMHLGSVREVHALLQLQEAWVGTWAGNSNATTACSAWAGVTCSPNGAVLALDSNAFAMDPPPTGTIPAAITDLTTLRYLDLTYGINLEGPMPSLSPLTHLTHLYVSHPPLSSQETRLPSPHSPSPPPLTTPYCPSPHRPPAHSHGLHVITEPSCSSDLSFFSFEDFVPSPRFSLNQSRLSLPFAAHAPSHSMGRIAPCACPIPLHMPYPPAHTQSPCTCLIPLHMPNPPTHAPSLFVPLPPAHAPPTRLPVCIAPCRALGADSCLLTGTVDELSWLSSLSALQLL
ncbi:unnamed protein product [Closterium sp. NIES-64]|nr:unnamed protein product [Closterium sp. NIES-64]